MSRFRPDEMQAMQSRFVTGCQRMPPEGSGLDAKQAETLWEQVEAFAGYGFNQGHATAYADVSYRMAYLKAHYPAAFLCARLADRGGYHHPAVYLAEATRLGLEIRPPHINISDLRFTLTYGNEAEQSPLPVLWMGLDQVRDLRRKTILTIQKERETGIFTSLRDFTNRVPLQDRELTHLIQSGGLDGLAPHRAALLAEVASHSYASKPYQRSFDFPSDVQASPETLAQRLEWEQHVLGFPVSVHPLQLVKEAGDDITPLRDLPTKVNQKVVIRGTRLPGWSRRESFFLSDGDTFVRVKMNETLSQNYRKPPPWEPIALRGIWRVDLWGSGWFSAEEVDTIQKG